MSSIIGILNQIKNGEVVLPAIQRDFVWNQGQIKHLFDSILRGYPVGIALLWETYEPLQYREFVKDYRSGVRAVFKDSDSGKRLRLVLDGQQRLQSLYVSIFGTLEGRTLVFDVLSGRDSDDTSEHKYVFDFLTKEEIDAQNESSTQYSKDGAVDPDEDWFPRYWFRVTELFSMSPKSREVFVANVSKKLKLSAEDQSRLRVNLAIFDQMLTKDTVVLKVSIIDENLPHDSEERKTEMDVLEIFVRVNTGGTRLNRSDLIFSMLKLNWKESAEELPEFVDRINEGNSLGLSTDFVIRCLFAVSDLGAKFDLDLLRKKSNVGKLRENFDRCCKSIEAVVDFVTQHCWIQSSRLLGGSSTLVPLVYYFFRLDKHRIPDAEVPKARRGLYLLAFSGALSRYAESRIGLLVRRDLKPSADSGSLEFPEAGIAKWVTYWHGTGTLNEDLIKANPPLVMHLVQGLSGGKTKYADNSPEIDHIFPRATLRERKVDEAQVNHFANFWILARGKNRNKSDKPPSKYFADVPDAELKRALIQRDLLKFPSYNRFIRERSKEIVAAVQRKLK